MDFKGKQTIFFITFICGVMNSEPISLNLTQLPIPGPVPLKVTRLGIPGPVTLNLTGLPIPEPTPLNVTKMPVPMTIPATNYYVKYFVLALQWPGAYDRECPHNGLPDFRIHGLWQQPQQRRGHHSRDPLQFHQNDNLLIKNLTSMWPSLVRPCNNRGFWEHEWQYHGAFSNFPSQQAYFKTTLRLTKQVARCNLLDVLNEHNIRPSAQVLHPAASFRSALRTVTGFGEIGCSRWTDVSHIYLCVDPQASKFIPCPRSFNMNSFCRSQVKFLPFNAR